MNFRRKGFSLFLLLLCGCSSVPESHYFAMSYVLLPKESGEPLVNAAVRVRAFDITSAYDQERLVYRYSPYEFQYYNYMLWAVKPQRMLTDLFVQHLQHIELFSSVGMEYGEQRPDYEISGMVQAVEELDSGNEWFAHLAFVVKLSRFGDEKATWTYQVDAKKQVFNKAPVYVVKALSELMEEETDKALTDLGRLLKQGKKPAEGKP
jgi:ABC-type uncharacterized transport system auxiliary subunit